MQTTLMEASNPANTTFMETRLHLDFGSQWTYITKDLSDNLWWEPMGKEMWTVCTFDNEKLKEITTAMVDVNL